jgi:hypothetical protein
MKLIHASSLLLLAIAGSAAHAQAKPKPPAAVKASPAAARQAPYIQSPPAQVGSPQLTELESKTIENIGLKAALNNTQQEQLKTALAALQQEYQQAVGRIMAEHPGYSWDAQHGALIPIPKPAEKK